MNSEKAQKVLSKFVAKGCIRGYLNHPITRGEFIYATNGHICVRVKKQEGIVSTVSDKPANLEQLFEQNRCDSYIPFPDIPPADKCKTCGGTGIEYACEDCDGKGEFEHGMHTYECKACSGAGQSSEGQGEKKDCYDCDGSGEDQHHPIEVGRQHFRRSYLAIISDLPGIRFAPHPTDENATAYFSFDGGEGLIMPTRV